MTRIAYLDCFSGISGDMIIGALIDAGLDIEDLRRELSNLKVSDYEISAEKIRKKNIVATKFSVSSSDKVSHRDLRELNRIVDNSPIDTEIKTGAKRILLKIAEAEARVHNHPVEKIHFHEIGAIDTIIDVVGTLIGIRHLGVEKVYCSRLNVGSGMVEFSHGKFPVPAPATAEILKGLPIYSTDIDAELVTPTGAAVVAILAEKFGAMPDMVVDAIGYGAGDRDLAHPNLLRIFVGSLVDENNVAEDSTISIIETTIDDMNPQLYEHVMERIFQNGALDIYLTNVFMKKSRPAVKLTVLSNPKDREVLIKTIFEETTSIGVRIREEKRAVLEREMKEIHTVYGSIRVKISRLNGKVVNAMPEFEDCRIIASEKNISLKQIYAEVYACLGISSLNDEM